jgi:hypothetical protein
VFCVILQFVNLVSHVLLDLFRTSCNWISRCNCNSLTGEKLCFLVDLNNSTRTLIAGMFLNVFYFFHVCLFVSVCIVVCLAFHSLISYGLEKFPYLYQVTGMSCCSSAILETIFSLELYQVCVINTWHKNALSCRSLPNAE